MAGRAWWGCSPHCMQTSRPAANPQGHQVQQALGPFLGLTQVILSKPQAEYHPMWGRHLTSLILPVLPLALAAETVPDLGLSSLEASRFKDRTIAPGWGRRSQMLSVCPEQDRQIPAQFTVSEIPIIRGVQWGSESIHGDLTEWLGQVPEVCFTQRA